MSRAISTSPNTHYDPKRFVHTSQGKFTQMLTHMGLNIFGQKKNVGILEVRIHVHSTYNFVFTIVKSK